MLSTDHLARDCFAWQVNDYDRATRVVLDERNGVEFQVNSDRACNWPDFAKLASVFRCTIRAVIHTPDECDGYKIATLANDEPFMMYDVYGDGHAFAKYQCLLPGFPVAEDEEADPGKTVLPAEQLFLRFEFDQTQMSIKMEDGDVRPTRNECWMHMMCLFIQKDRYPTRDWETHVNQGTGNPSGYGNRATPADVFAALTRVGWV